MVCILMFGIHTGLMANPTDSGKSITYTEILQASQKHTLTTPIHSLPDRSLANREIVYYEDFAGSFPAGWQNVVINGPAGFPGWEWTDVGGDYGGQLNSTTAANGYMILDSDAYGTGVPEEADLISPSIDCSALTGDIFFSVEHWARTFGAADIRILLSTDNFVTETELYRWYGGEVNSANGTNPVISNFDITTLVQGESNVKIKFKWIGAYDYWWLVDDFTLYEVSEYHNLTMLEPDGEGTVIPTPGVHSYPAGQIVNLSAVPAPGWTFDSWTGPVADPDSPATTVTMNDDYTVQAAFLPPDLDLLWYQGVPGESANTSVVDGTINYRVADNFDNPYIDEISRVVVYGLVITHDGTGWIPWIPGDTEPFILRIFDQYADQPDWNNPLYQFNIDAEATYIQEVWGAYDLYKFELELDTPISLNQGWISPQIDVDAGAGGWFLWIEAIEGDGDDIAWQQGQPQLEYDLMLELWGSELAFMPGSISGTVTLDGPGNVEDVLVSATGHPAVNPHPDGSYQIIIDYPGTFNVTASLQGFQTETQQVAVAEGQDITGVNFELNNIQIDVDPAMIVEQVVYPASETVQLEIINSGTGELEYSISVWHDQGEESRNLRYPALPRSSVPENPDYQSSDLSSLTIEALHNNIHRSTESEPRPVELSRELGWNWLFPGVWGDIPDNSIGLNNPGIWLGGAILDLSDDIGYAITSIGGFDYPESGAANSITARVFTGDYNAPTALVGQSAPYVPSLSGEYFELELFEPVFIEAPGIYWIVFRIDDLGDGFFPFATIDPHVQNAGKIIIGDNPFGTWGNLIDYGLDESWLIGAWVELSISFISVDPIAGTVPAGSSVFLDITLDTEGLDFGTYNGEIIISNNAQQEPVIVPVEMTVVGGEPALSVNPSSWNYGDVELMNPAAKEFILGNLSNIGTLTINNIELEGTNPSDFVLEAPGLPFDITDTETIPITVTFLPQSLGLKTAQLRIAVAGEFPADYPLSGNCIQEEVGQPVGLTADLINYDNVLLQWGLSYGAVEGWLGWNTGITDDAIGGPELFNAAIKFGIADLGGYQDEGFDLTHVRFEPYLAEGATPASYSVRVWTGSDAQLGPTTLLVDQAVPSVTFDEWNEIELTNPVPISGTEPLWVGVYITAAVDQYPLACDAGPAVPGKGGLISVDGLTWDQLSDFGINSNWMIEAYVEPASGRGERTLLSLTAPDYAERIDRRTVARPEALDLQLAADNTRQTRALRGYDIYRNGALIAELVPVAWYLDEELPEGAYDYYVEAVYWSQTSLPSNLASVIIDLPDPLQLPLIEGFDSESFTANYWTRWNNWFIVTDLGQPEPAAMFYYDPHQTNYSINLTSWELNGVEASEITVQFDLLLQDYVEITTLEQLSFEVFDGTEWQIVDTFNNLLGDIAWTNNSYDISAHAAGRVFQIRFRAHGEDNWSIDWWVIDNIVVETGAVALDPPDNVTSVITGNNVVISWDIVDGANSYYIYSSADPYTEDWGLPIAQVGLEEFSEPVNERKFYKVTASTDQPAALLQESPSQASQPGMLRNIR